MSYKHFTAVKAAPPQSPYYTPPEAPVVAIPKAKPSSSSLPVPPGKGKIDDTSAKIARMTAPSPKPSAVATPKSVPKTVERSLENELEAASADDSISGLPPSAGNLWPPSLASEPVETVPSLYDQYYAVFMLYVDDKNFPMNMHVHIAAFLLRTKRCRFWLLRFSVNRGASRNSRPSTRNLPLR